MRQVFLRRGISAYVGILLMVALSVASGAIFIALSGSLDQVDSSEITRTSQTMILDSAILNHRELIVYIRNSGKNTIEIDKIYIDDVLVAEPESVIEVNDPGESDDVIQGGEVGKLIVQPLSGFNRGKNFKFKIISRNGEIIEFQRKTPFEAPRVVFTDSRNKGVSGILVQYRFNGWQDLGVTDENGEVLLLLEPRRYRFRLSYGGATLQKTQNIADNQVVKFKTVNVTVRLVQSDGTPISGANARYSAGGWKTIGNTNINGRVSIELLPKSYNFRITLNGSSLQKTQNIADNSIVEFQTDDVFVRLVSSIGEPIIGAIVEYSAGGWRTLGTTNVDGEVSASLLPMSYSFRVKYAGATQQKTQDVGDDPFVIFATELVTVKFVDSEDAPIIGGEARYSASGWKKIGMTDESGEVMIELLPLSYSFRMYYGGTYLQKRQNIRDFQLVEYQTVNVTIVAWDGFGAVVDAYARYQASGWQIIGYTDETGSVSSEILPRNLRFRLTVDGNNYYVRQNVAVDPIVEFNIS